MCENLGPLAQYSHSDSYIYLLILIAMLVIFALSAFNISTQFVINGGKMAQLSSMSVIADQPIRSSVGWLSNLPQTSEQLVEGCDRPKSSLLHCCIFPVAKYLSVVITFILGGNALWRWVGEVSASLMRSTTIVIPARSNL